MLRIVSLVTFLMMAWLVSGDTVGDWNFGRVRGKEVLDASTANNPGRLYGTAQIIYDEFGAPVLDLGPGYGGMAVSNSDSLSLSDELTVLFWFCPEAFPDASAGPARREMALVIKNWNWYIGLLSSGQLYSILTETNGNAIRTLVPVRLELHKWYYLAMSFSRSSGNVTYYLDGNPVASGTVTAGLQPEQGEIRWGSAGSDYYPFYGRMTDIMVFNRAMSGSEIGNMASSRLGLLAGELKRRIERLPASSDRDDWLRRCKEPVGIAAYRALEAAGLRLLHDASRGQNGLSVWVVPAISAIPILPDSFLGDENRSNLISVVGAHGEFESASVVLRSTQDLHNVVIEPHAVKTSSGNTIPADAWDIKLVKCWYQAGFAGLDTEPQDKSLRVLIPELLLNDNSLIKVDFEQAKNYAKLPSPDGGEHYVDISQDAESDKMIWTNRMSITDFPIRDAGSLQPFDLPARFNQQIWLTIKIPNDAKPGMYSGEFTISADGMKPYALTVNLSVLPFELSEAKTHYNLDEPYTGSVYHLAFLRGGKGSIDPFDRTEAQYRKELEDIRDHGITNPLISDIGAFSHPEAFKRMLEIRREVGLETKPLFLFGAGELEGILKCPPDEKNRAELRRQVRSLMDAVEKVLGHREVYIYGIDEAVGSQLANELVYWGDIRSEGAKTFVSGHHGPDVVEGRQDLMLQYKVTGASLAEAWHQAHGKLWSYGNPQGGVENPDLYRRNYGLGLWRADYDGISTYCYTDMWGHPWNDFDSSYHRDINFVYPTADGVVDTIEWAGYREAMDDVRYATTLKLAIRDSENQVLAKQANAWLENLDWRKCDLNAVRLEMIGWILRLKGIAP